MKRFQKEWLVIAVVFVAIILATIQFTQPAYAVGYCHDTCICNPTTCVELQNKRCTEIACPWVEWCHEYCICIC